MNSEIRKKIGQALIQNGLLTPEQLTRAEALAQTENRELEEILIRFGWIREPDFIQAVSRALSVPWVSPSRIAVAPEVMKMISREASEKYRVIPLFVQQRGGEETLYVATSDPTDERMLAELASLAGRRVRPMLASRADIELVLKSSPTGLVQQKEEHPSVGAVTLREPFARGEMSVQNSDSPDAEPEIQAQEIERKKAQPAFSLTLLDGTQIKLPQRERGERRETRREETKPIDAPQWEMLLTDLIALLIDKKLIEEDELSSALQSFLRRH